MDTTTLHPATLVEDGRSYECTHCGRRTNHTQRLGVKGPKLAIHLCPSCLAGLARPDVPAHEAAVLAGALRNEAHRIVRTASGVARARRVLAEVVEILHRHALALSDEQAHDDDTHLLAFIEEGLC